MTSYARGVCAKCALYLLLMDLVQNRSEKSKCKEFIKLGDMAFLKEM